MTERLQLNRDTDKSLGLSSRGLDKGLEVNLYQNIFVQRGDRKKKKICVSVEQTTRSYVEEYMKMKAKKKVENVHQKFFSIWGLFIELEKLA